MKLAIISDTHGYFERVKIAVEKFFTDAEIILHSGDVLAHGV